MNQTFLFLCRWFLADFLICNFWFFSSSSNSKINHYHLYSRRCHSTTWWRCRSGPIGCAGGPGTSRGSPTKWSKATIRWVSEWMNTFINALLNGFDNIGTNNWEGVLRGGLILWLKHNVINKDKYKWTNKWTTDKWP